MHADNTYDLEAKYANWLGPEVVFGLSFEYVKPGEILLDIGIGTGLASQLYYKAGLKIWGMDISNDMLNICRQKNITVDLKKHDLTDEPYPFDSESSDHIVCIGTLHFFQDLNLIFRESSRIIKTDGIFVFTVADQNDTEDEEIIAGPELTHTAETIIMYRHNEEKIMSWSEQYGLNFLRSLEFPINMNRERTKSFRAKAYITRKTS